MLWHTRFILRTNHNRDAIILINASVKLNLRKRIMNWTGYYVVVTVFHAGCVHPLHSILLALPYVFMFIYVLLSFLLFYLFFHEWNPTMNPKSALMHHIIIGNVICALCSLSVFWFVFRPLFPQSTSMARQRTPLPGAYTGHICTSCQVKHTIIALLDIHIYAMRNAYRLLNGIHRSGIQNHQLPGPLENTFIYRKRFFVCLHLPISAYDEGECITHWSN